MYGGLLCFVTALSISMKRVVAELFIEFYIYFIMFKESVMVSCKDIPGDKYIESPLPSEGPIPPCYLRGSGESGIRTIAE